MSNSHTVATFLTLALCTIGAARSLLRFRKAPLAVSLLMLLGTVGHAIAAASLGRSIPPSWVTPLSWVGVFASGLLVFVIFRVKVRETAKAAKR